MAAFKCQRPQVAGATPTVQTVWKSERPPLVGVRAIAPGERDTWTDHQKDAWDGVVLAGVRFVAAFDGIAVNTKNDYTEPKKAVQP